MKNSISHVGFHSRHEMENDGGNANIGGGAGAHGVVAAGVKCDA